MQTADSAVETAPGGYPLRFGAVDLVVTLMALLAIAAIAVGVAWWW